MLLDYLKLAISNLRKRRLRSWLTMIGIFIGIAAVVSLIGLGEGLRVAIMSQFSFLGTDILAIQASGLSVGMPGTGAITPLTDDLAEKIEKVNGVKSAINRYMKTGTLEFNDRQGIGVAFSVAGGEKRKIVIRSLNIKAAQGRLLRDGDTRKVLLGHNFGTDDIFGKPIQPGNRVLLSDIPYEVVGIIEKKGNFMIDNAVAVNEEQLLKDFGDDGTVSMIMVVVDDPKEIDTVQANIEKLLRNERGVKEGEEDFSVTSPQQILESLDSALFAVQLFVMIIAGISLVVGGIGIMNTMYTAVLERTKEIGIMKAIGARNSTIFTIFSIESGFLGMTGGLIGIVLGLILAYGFAFLGKMFLGSELIQAHVPIFWILFALCFSFVLGMLAGLLPAYKASQMQPVDALRYSK